MHWRQESPLRYVREDGLVVVQEDQTQRHRWACIDAEGNYLLRALPQGVTKAIISRFGSPETAMRHADYVRPLKGRERGPHDSYHGPDRPRLEDTDPRLRMVTSLRSAHRLFACLKQVVGARASIAKKRGDNCSVMTHGRLLLALVNLNVKLLGEDETAALLSCLDVIAASAAANVITLDETSRTLVSAWQGALAEAATAEPVVLAR